MRIPLDRESSRPLYEQLQDWLRATIASGGLVPGTRVPSSRELAAELSVGRVTVENAYAALLTDGLLVTRERSGTFVAPPPALVGDREPVATSWPRWNQEHGPTGPPARTGRPDVVAFTGVGDPRQYPVAGFARAVKDVLRDDGAEALGYGDLGPGHAPLRGTIAHLLASQGIRADPADVLVTSGSQQALALVCSVLVRPGDRVAVEQPTYDHALELFRAHGAEVVGVPVDAHGMDVDRLERVLEQQSPRLLYTIPNFQNPTGATLGLDRRRRLLELAARYDVQVLEDDFVGDLRYDGRGHPALTALDPDGRVIYVGTFSKILMPGVRVGYLLAHGALRADLADRKRAHDLTTSPLMQRALDRYLTVGRYQAYLRRVTRVYRERRDTVLAELAAQLRGWRTRSPAGGLFCWTELPAPLRSPALARAGLEHGVEVAPGGRFFVDPEDGGRFVRLNVVTCTPDEIRLGIGRLAAAGESLGA